MNETDRVQEWFTHLRTEREGSPLTERQKPRPAEKNLTPYLLAFAQEQGERGLNEKTISAQATDLRLFHETVHKDLAQVTRRNLRRVLLRYQQAGFANATIQRRAATLRSFYDFLFAVGLIKSRPTLNLALPKGWELVPRAPAADDLELVIAAVGREAPLDLRDRAVLLLLRDSGLRATALTHICIADIDWENARVIILHDKYGKQRRTPMTHRTVEALREYIEQARPLFLKEREIPYLFPGVNIPYLRGRKVRRGGDHLTRQQIFHIAKRWTKQVLGTVYSPHKWRAGCFTEAAAGEMDNFDLMNLAGHSDPETTERYIRHEIGHLKERYYAMHPRAGRKPGHDAE
jgi:site-specific recombinase XerD